MAITKHVDPKTRKPFLMAEGTVTGAYVNDIKEVKTYSGPNGPWTPTKRLSIVVDGTRIDLGMSEKDKIRAKDVDDNYQDVVKGVEVSVVVEENGEYQGKTQYKAKTSGITVLDISKAEAPTKAGAPAAGGQAGGQTSFKPKDMTGVRVGHAINGALNYVLSNGIDYDMPGLVDIAKVVDAATDNVRATYAADNPGMSDYDVGAASGHAVLNACRMVGEADNLQVLQDEIITLANALLSEVVPTISEHIKEGAKAPAPKATKVVPAKKAATRAKPLPKPAVDEAPDLQEPDRFADMDDDPIPF